MPTYLCHGFRWQRRNIRVYVILQNLDDASPDWITPARSSQYILCSFYEIFDFLPFCSPANGRYDPTREPDNDHDGRILDYRSQSQTRSRSQSRSRARSRSQSATSRCHSRAQSRAGPQLLPPLPITAADDDESSAEDIDDDFAAQSWSAIKLLEEYDPRDLSAVSRPYAYVADYAVRIDLSCNIAEEIARYEQLQFQSSYPAIGIPSSKDGAAAPEPGWFERLRDELQRGEEIGWYVVVNNDEERDWANDGGSEVEFEPAGPPPAVQGYEQCRPHPYHPRSQSRGQLRRQPSSYLYQAQPARPLPTIEQRHHHAQYLLQQKIFEAIDQEAQAKEEPVQQPQSQESSPPPSQDQNQKQQQQQLRQKQNQLTPEEREQQRKQAEEELKRQKQLLFEKAEQKRREELEQQRQQQHIAALRDQELKKERERNTSSNTTHSHHARRGTDASSKAGSQPQPAMVIRPKMSFDAGMLSRPKMSFDGSSIARPKTPGSSIRMGSGGGFRRLFGRGSRVAVEGSGY
ncbi:hypothetical protein VTJ49DRAFT_305 [Mycothermus thermophilus]|uniref:Uncharacterized protein n=1 Tax=Humicola insolens TaxID=85995 RepID=A0ABR3VGZ8_HUMIN